MKIMHNRLFINSIEKMRIHHAYVGVTNDLHYTCKPQLDEPKMGVVLTLQRR